MQRAKLHLSTCAVVTSLSVLALSLACTRSPSAPTAVIDVRVEPRGAPENVAGRAASSDAADASASVHASARSPYPPTGEYEVTARVVFEGCATTYRPPAPWKKLVTATVEGGRARVHVPVAAVPPFNATWHSVTAEFVVAPLPDPPSTATLVPLSGCPSYVVKQTRELVSADGSGFVVAYTVEHGDPIMCSTLQPSKCTTKVEQRYELRREICPAECTRKLPPGDGPAPPAAPTPSEVDCRCR